MPRSSFRLSASRILPLPGIGELEGAINGLRDTLNASGCVKEEYQSLVNHLESLLDIARSANQPEGSTELFSELTYIKSRLEAEFNRKPRINMIRSQARLELLDDLNRGVDRMIMKFHLRLLAQSNRLPVAQGRKSGIENMLVIPSHEILPQEETWSRIGQHSSSRGLLGDPYGTDDGRVVISQRLGKYNKLSVIHKTYSSMSDDAAAERAEMELKFLSKFLHKNIANVVGITKGYYGLNGIIMQIDAKGELPPVEFLSRPMSGAALVRYIRGVHSALSFISRRPEGWGRVDSVTTRSNGHVTMVPSPRSSKGSGVGPFKLFNPQPLEPQLTINPGLRLILSLQLESESVYAVGGPTSLKALGFLEEVSKLSLTSLSELSVLKIASDLGLSPFSERRVFVAVGAPSLIFSPDNIGYLIEHEGLSPLENLRDDDRFETQAVSFDILTVKSWPTWRDCCQWRSCPGASAEFSTWTVHCNHEFHGIDLEYTCSALEWNAIAQKARQMSIIHHVDINKLVFCRDVRLSIRTRSRGINHQGPIYFHVNRLQRSNPREFWGFFSSSSDPRLSSTRLEALGWSFQYEINADFYDIKDDFGLRYEAALNEGLANMPGGYPGGSFEQVSTEETE